MGWPVFDVNAKLDRLTEQFVARGMAEEDIAADALVEEPTEPEPPRHRRRRLGEAPPPEIF